MLEFGKTSYTDFVFVRNEFLSLFGAQTESLSLIIIYYIFKYAYGINNFARVTSEPKKAL